MATGLCVKNACMFFACRCLQVIYLNGVTWGCFNGTMYSTTVKFPKQRPFPLQLPARAFFLFIFFTGNGNNHLLLSEEHLQLIRFAGQFLEKPPKTINTVSVKPAPCFTKSIELSVLLTKEHRLFVQLMNLKVSNCLLKNISFF